MTNLVQILYLGYSCNYLQPVLFIFDLPLILRVVQIRNKKRNNKHGILQTWSIVSVATLLNKQERPPRKYCYQSSEITAYRNKISLKLGYRTVNARKYVRCTRTSYLLSSDISSDGSIAIFKKFDFDFYDSWFYISPTV